MTEFSTLAIQAQGVRDPRNARLRKPWGFLLHTTGGGVTDLAKKSRETPISVAIKTYVNSQNGSNGYLWGGPSYVIDHDGSIYQLAPDSALTAHAGGPNRQHYLDGSWEGLVSPATLLAWKTAHPDLKNPYSGFPSTSPNVDYVGCEMIPVGDGFGGEPMRPGLRFTLAQHDSAIKLARDIGERNGFPAGWAKTNRLTGHEDVDPIERSDKGGGWDPGMLRVLPYFDLNYVRAGV